MTTTRINFEIADEMNTALEEAGKKMNGYSRNQVAVLLITQANIDAVVTKFERAFGPAPAPSSNGVGVFDAARD